MAAAMSADCFVYPPMMRAMERNRVMMDPGSARSGQLAARKSVPTLRPDASSITGMIWFSSVPGPMVLSTTMREPRWSPFPVSFAALRMYSYSGTFSSVTGVGTERIMTSELLVDFAVSNEAVRCPLLMA